MKDLRSAHFSEISATLTGKRAFVYAAMQIHSPCTAIELAAKLVPAWDKTSVRPRFSELREAGLIEETGVRRNGEHEFRHVPLALAEQRARAAAIQQEAFCLTSE